MTTAPAPRMPWSAFAQAAPGVIAALRALNKSVEDAGLDKPLIELLKIRVSQLNDCAFCLQFHRNAGRAAGLPAAKLDLVATWAEAGLYTPRERAALAWAEALTQMNRHAVTDALYAGLQGHFTPDEIAHLTASIGAINAWNRIAGGLRFTPPDPA